MFFYEVSLFQFLKVNWFKGKWKKKKKKVIIMWVVEE